jgi:hypothetical protein
MGTTLIPRESDFRKWIKDALKEYLDNNPDQSAQPAIEEGKALLSRKEIAGLFRISLSRCTIG